MAAKRASSAPTGVSENVPELLQEQISGRRLHSFVEHRHGFAKLVEGIGANQRQIVTTFLFELGEHVGDSDAIVVGRRLVGSIIAGRTLHINQNTAGDEVFLSCIRTFHNYAYLSTAYSSGLGLQEGLHLEVSDIDSKRMMIHVHRGKGAKDRYVPLPESTLKPLRTKWATNCNFRLIFSALGRNGKRAPDAKTPMAKSSVQGAFRHAEFEAGILKKGVCVHTLRPHIFWKSGSIFESSKDIWRMRTSKPRWSIST